MELWGEGEAATPSTMPRLRLSLRDSIGSGGLKQVLGLGELERKRGPQLVVCSPCLLYTSDAADDWLVV